MVNIFPKKWLILGDLGTFLVAVQNNSGHTEQRYPLLADYLRGLSNSNKILKGWYTHKLI
jgi:hypothetical protein